ncbi:hypothetical protein TWF694_004198 [Orbilia ellipsospora]|uniref:Uncharacterized protein n=1 Tax=Orbilia ellipsospora TaxID=2528407 RepID=A0AAV9WZI1_9PEZI
MTIVRFNLITDLAASTVPHAFHDHLGMLLTEYLETPLDDQEDIEISITQPQYGKCSNGRPQILGSTPIPFTPPDSYQPEPESVIECTKSSGRLHPPPRGIEYENSNIFLISNTVYSSHTKKKNDNECTAANQKVNHDSIPDSQAYEDSKQKPSLIARNWIFRPKSKPHLIWEFEDVKMGWSTIVSGRSTKLHVAMEQRRQFVNVGTGNITPDCGFIFPTIEEEYYEHDYDDSRRDSKNPFYVPYSSRQVNMRVRLENMPPHSFDITKFRHLQKMFRNMVNKPGLHVLETPYGISLGDWCVFGDKPRNIKDWTIYDYGRCIKRLMEEKFERKDKFIKIFGVAIAGYEAVLIELNPKPEGCIWSGVYDLKIKGHQREFLWLLVNAAADAYRGENMYAKKPREDTLIMRKGLVPKLPDEDDSIPLPGV